MNKRIKIKCPVVTTRQEAEALASEIAGLIIEQRQYAADLDAGINELRDTYAAKLSTLDKAIKEKTTVMQAWAEANPAEFGGLKSLDMTSAVVGWRTGMHQLKTLAGWTWDRVLEKLRLLSLAGFIRTKEEVNKQAIIDSRELLTSEQLRNIGCRIVQDEAFFVEPKISDSTTRITQEVQ